MERRIGQRADDKVLKYFLDKFREDFHKRENERRAELRAKEMNK